MKESGGTTLNDPRISVSADGLRKLGHKARMLSFLPRQPAQSILNGRHASKLRGRGLTFEELREYADGDDIRTIDWKVTARTRVPHVRVFTEERDRPTLLIVDQRMSMFFGSRVYMKSVIAAEAAALAAHRVLAQGDRVGGMVFGDDVISEHRPQRSRRALNQLLNSIAQANALLSATAPTAENTSINEVLRSAVRIAHSNALVMVFSDLDGVDARTERLFAALARANDLILFNISDSSADSLPGEFRLTATDGGLQAEIDTTEATQREKVEVYLAERVAQVETWSRRYGFPLLSLTTADPALDQILRLLGHRVGTR